MKTHWKKTLNKDYLGSHDLDDGNGGYTDIKASILRVEQRDVTDPQGAKSREKVAIFSERIKPMILNIGACKIVEKFAGSPYIEDWKNIPVHIYVEQNVKAFGDTVDALRFHKTQPRMREELTPDHPKWAGAAKSFAENGDLSVITKFFDISPENVELLKAGADA